jgi:hypothetical protein
VTLLVLGSISLALALWTTVSPSIRNAPSLSELDQPNRPATMEA